MSLSKPGKILKAEEVTFVGSPLPPVSKEISRGVVRGTKTVSAPQGAPSPPRQSPISDPDAGGRNEEAAYRRGYDEGVRAARRDGQSEAAPRLAALDRLLAELQTYRQDLLKRQNSEIVSLAFMIAGKVIRTEVTINSNVVARALDDAAASLHGSEKIVIRCNPDDYDWLKILEPDFAVSSGASHVAIEKDGAVSRGSLVFDTPSGGIDATIETHLDAVRKALDIP